MTSVGIRELRQRASALLRLVEAGESVEITDRGRPVAMLVPMPADEGPLAEMRRRGEIIPATIQDDFDEPLAFDGEPASVILDRQRAERLRPDNS